MGSADSSACAYQGPASAVTGTGAAATYYTCSLPAGVMGAGQGIIITVVAKHTTGTVAVSYTLSFGGTSTTAALTYTDTTVTAGTSYSYCVTTVDSLNEESACSAPATANVPSNPNAPSAPLITVK